MNVYRDSSRSSNIITPQDLQREVLNDSEEAGFIEAKYIRDETIDKLEDGIEAKEVWEAYRQHCLAKKVQTQKIGGNTACSKFYSLLTVELNVVMKSAHDNKKYFCLRPKD